MLALCSAAEDARPELVDWVFDGDTIGLHGGRRLRLIGIDTPELGRDGAPDQPGARVARDRLQELLAAVDYRVLLQVGPRPADSYGRLLAHVYLPDGRNLTRLLLLDGLGAVVAIPPSLTHLECYRSAEREARAAGRGLWRKWVPVVPGDLPAGAEGFHLLRGRIARVGQSRSSVWLNLEGELALRIDRADLKFFPGLEPERLVGRELEVRGWIYRRNGEQRMRLRHPAALRWLEE